ncbi:ADP-ribose diphosphatase [Paraglaciecola aestuariivivens]
MPDPTPANQQFSSQDVQILDKTPLYQGFFNMVKYRFKHKLFAGGWSQPVEREIFERGHAVAVLPYDPVLDEIVLIEQIRIGALDTSCSPWLFEVVAGMIDKGESPEQVCCREAKEEAGLTIKSLTKALSYLSSPGGTTERIHIYIGQVDASQAQGVHGLDNEQEDILVRRVSTQTAIQWMEQGKIDNAASLIALQWFVLNKAKLIANWEQK